MSGNPVVLRSCSNPACQKVHKSRAGLGNKSGLCPKCLLHAKRGEGWRIDPDIYAECQRIKAIEPKLNSSHKVAAYERERLAALEATPPRVDVLAALAYLSDGYTPTSHNGKVRAGTGNIAGDGRS